MGGIIAVSVIIFIVLVLVNYNMAQNMQSVVEKKGYTDVRVVALCFWLGLFGYLYVIALPDLEEHKLLKQIVVELDKSEENFGKALSHD